MTLSRSAKWTLAAFALIAGMAVILLMMGHVPICKCGYVKLWHGDNYSSENSQHLTDWYTFSHIIHGLLFYAATWLLFRNQSFGFRLFLATLVETGWEILENSDFIINRYREVTISLDYYGDSVINSVFDVLAMVLGFWLASKLPVRASIAIIITLELFVGWMIRDNLTLNILMLLWPLDAVREWQAAGA